MSDLIPVRRVALLSSLKDSRKACSYGYSPSGRGSTISIFSGSRLSTVTNSFFSNPNRIMVRILSSGSSSKIPASTAVRPRLMPLPSMEIFGGRYCILRLSVCFLPWIIIKMKKPIKSSGKNAQLTKLHSREKKLGAEEPSGSVYPPSEGKVSLVISVPAGTAEAGNAAPKKYSL